MMDNMPGLLENMQTILEYAQKYRRLRYIIVRNQGISSEMTDPLKECYSCEDFDSKVDQILKENRG